jgi:hypothetical protein
MVAGFAIEKNATFKFPIEVMVLMPVDPIVKLNER